MRTFYSQVKLVKEAQAADLHRFLSRKAVTNLIAVDNPSDPKQKGTLMIWASSAFPGMITVVRRRKEDDAHIHLCASQVLYARMTQPTEEDIELAELWERRFAGPQSALRQKTQGGK